MLLELATYDELPSWDTRRLRKKILCHAEPFAVTLSEAKGLQFARSG